jgi:hypothetical protein
MNFLGEGVPAAGKFLFEIRRVQTRSDFFKVCEAYLDHDEPMRLDPTDCDIDHAAPAAHCA